MNTITPSSRKVKSIHRMAISTIAGDIFKSKTPYAALESGKIMIRSWANTLKEGERSHYAQNFMVQVMESFWTAAHASIDKKRRLPFLFANITVKKLDALIIAVAEAIGEAAAKLPINESSYLLGSMYTAVLPDSARTAGGVFYTPPTLTNRLIELAENAGVNWSTAKVIDPACGGGAFLAPICEKIIMTLSDRKPTTIHQHIQTHIRGWEIDPFAGWLTQVFVEVVLKDILSQCDDKFLPVVTIVDSLQKQFNKDDQFDLVIGNPPYGKLKLTDELRGRFEPSLYGHANLYGIFTQLAIELCKPKGVVAYLTPTSFLSGEYFKKLRHYIRLHTSIAEIDFVSSRSGVFEDVLQETILASYRKVPNGKIVSVNEILPVGNNSLLINPIGGFILPMTSTAPWILPRSADQAPGVKTMQEHTHFLSDWGYEVSTGPLVWNRHKPQLTNRPGKRHYPIIWAESITFRGTFKWKAEKVNHQPYLRFEKGDEWLVSKKPCILLQRTTAKEQDKRLIAAALPERLRRSGVVVENHLNMILAKNESPAVPARVLSVFLNSKVVNKAFRSISGSVAVSAYELESLPLPPPASLSIIHQLLQQRASDSEIEKACEAVYNTLP